MDNNNSNNEQYIENDQEENQINNYENDNNQNELNQDEQNIENDEEEEEEIDEDEYLMELQFRLTKMRQERKEAEQNAKLLDNRLNMLKKEEDKQWKKIENKKRLANEKLMHVKSMAEMIRQKQLLEMQKEEEIKRKRKVNQEMKQTIKDNTEARRAEKQRQIQEEAKILKLQKEYNRQLLAYLNAEQLNSNKTKCECIKSQYSIEKERKMIMEKERKKRLRAELEKKLLEEYRLKEEAEEKKNKNEQEEIELVKRLQTTTQIQQNSKLIKYIFIIYMYIVAAEIEKINLENALKGNISFDPKIDKQMSNSSSKRTKKK